MVARGPFQTVTLRREPKAIAFTAPSNASSLFELESGNALPFEGMRVDMRHHALRRAGGRGLATPGSSKTTG